MNSYETRPHGIMFHHFHDVRHPVGQGSLSSDQFEAMIRFLKRERILSAGDWMDRALHGRLREGDLCLTFDDNLRCQYDVAVPVLNALGITAFWFVYNSVMQGNLERLEIYRHYRHTRYSTMDEFYEEFCSGLADSEHAAEVAAALKVFDPAAYLKDFTFYTANDRKFRFLRDQVLGVERYNQAMDRMMEVTGFDVAGAARDLWMDETCVKELHRDGHLIGLHSFSHPTQIGALDKQRQQLEYGSNHDYLAKLLGSKPMTMSHPCNSYNSDTLEILGTLGIRLGFRANMVRDPRFGPLEFPREDHANVLKQMS
jgi:peptidoglycan/xylan/chitin deacetylase (PgdA/CDA1 family)